MSIVATILSGNNESLVRDAIGTVRDWIDTIVLIDTGITDGTLDVARDTAGAKLRVERFDWSNDFAAARNYALHKATALGATWVLTVDTDERLRFPGIASSAELRVRLDSDPQVLTWLVPNRDGSYSKERFIRVPTALRWQGRTHEALVGAAADQRRILTGVEFWEIPKTREQYQAKLRRDLVLLRVVTDEKPQDARWWYYLGQTLEELSEHRPAADAFRRCYELRGQWAEQAAWACFRAATCWLMLNEFEQALEICGLGLARQAQSPELAWLAGLCCYRLGRFADAVAWEQMAIAMGHFEGHGAGKDRISFRHLPGWYEGPYDVLRFAWRSLGQPTRAEECDRKFASAKGQRLGRAPLSAGAAVQPGDANDAAGASFHLGARDLSRPTRIAVLGLYSSGSSALAGVLHHLGVCLGRHYSASFFEPFGLATQLRQWWREPELREAVPRADRVRELRHWMCDLEREGTSLTGAKHPLLCLCGPDLQEAWGPETKFLWSYRPLEQSIASLTRRAWWPGRERQMQSRLWRAVTDFFGQQTHLKVDYDDLLAHPERQITRIIEYLGLDPDPALTRTALRSIRTRSPMAGDGNGQTPRPERKVLFDLGTHHGEGLRHLRQELSLDGTWEIHAYEANPACHVCRWLQGVPLPIQVHETAVWIRDGQVTFRQHNRRALSQGSSPDATSDVDGWASCLAELGSSHPDLEPAVEVPCEDFARLLEAYSAEDFVVVKMDVEGAEFAILRHLIKREVVQRIRRLYIEWHDHLVPTETGCTRRQLEQQLRCLGLEVLPWD